MIVSRDNKTWTVSLDEKLKWHSKSSYLRQYLNQISMHKSGSSIREIMKSAKRDLEYGGYSLELDQSHESVISDIIIKNKEIRDFWSNAHGWAPSEAAELLAKSRLDWQVSLSYCLRLWLDTPNDDDVEGRLILAWVNLGSLLEGTMKFSLSVYEADYSKSPKMRKKRNSEPEPISPDELKLELLKQVFSKEIWTDSQKQSFCSLVDRIQERRNAIHAYKDKYIGTFEDFFEDLSGYLDLLEEIGGQVPYP